MSVQGVTFLTSSFPLSLDAISSVFIARLVRNLSEQVEVKVVTPADRQSAGPSLRHGDAKVMLCRYAPKKLQIIAQTPGGIPVALKRQPWLYVLLPSLLLSLLVSTWRVARTGTVLHANWAICGVLAAVVGRLLGQPVITTLRGEDVTRAQVFKLDRTLVALCLHLSDRVVCVSSDMQRWLRAQFPEQLGKLDLIENGVDDSFLAVGAARAWEESPSTIRLITVGSLIPRKGIDQIIRAMALTEDPARMTLVIVGGGPEERHLRQLVYENGLGDRVRFAGPVAADEVPALLAEADIFILASHREGRPNVLLEAMAAALPVIASDIPGVGEIVKHERTGLLFSDGDAVQLARFIDILARQPDLRRSSGQAARQMILDKGLTWSECARKYVNLYQAVTKA